MARPKSLHATCKWDNCGLPTRSRIYCKTHAQAWRRKFDKDRCEWPDCREIVAYDAQWQELIAKGKRRGKVKKIDGRVWDTGQGPKGYCRQHEVEHLRPTPEIEGLNLKRLGLGLDAVGQCWVPQAKFRPTVSAKAKKPRRPEFGPEGTMSQRGQWIYARVVWDLLMGGTGQRQVLDHLTECTEEPDCVSPAHLQPVTDKVNFDRRKHRRSARKKKQPFDPKTCGPPLNDKALKSEAVQVFAYEYGLPLHGWEPQ